MQFSLNNGVCVEFDVHVLPYLKTKDQEVLQIAANDPNRYLKELSPEFKACLLAIGGAESADLLGVEPSSYSKSYLDLRHFENRPIKFSVQHISKLPEWTKGKIRGKSSGDRIVVDSLLGPPYLQGDHKAVDPSGDSGVEGARQQAAAANLPPAAAAAPPQRPSLLTAGEPPPGAGDSGPQERPPPQPPKPHPLLAAAEAASMGPPHPLLAAAPPLVSATPVTATTTFPRSAAAVSLLRWQYPAYRSLTYT